MGVAASDAVALRAVTQAEACHPILGTAELEAQPACPSITAAADVALPEQTPFSVTRSDPF